MTLLLFVCSGAWGDNTPAAAGTYATLKAKKPGGENKFYKLGDGVFLHRKSNSSWDDNKGMKLNQNTNGVAIYISTPMKIKALVYKKSSKDEAVATFNVYTITNGSSTFDLFESGTDNSTTVSVTTAETPSYSFSVTFEALDSKAEGEQNTDEVTIAAGYYYVVGTSESTNTYVESVTLTAASTYSVTYKANNGTAEADVVDDEATTISGCPNTFTAPSGKIFAGWNTQADGKGTDYAVGAAVTGNLELFAQWISTYTVEFDLQGHGSAIDAQEVAEGGKVTEPTAPIASGYDFNGWYKEAECTNAWNFDTDVVTATTTLYAKWTEHIAPTYGSIFSLNMTYSGSDVNVNHGTETALGTYGTATNGTVVIGNKHASDDSKAKITSSGVYFNGNDAYIEITFTDALKTGDVINFTNPTNTKQICLTTDKTYSNTYKTSSGTYTCDAAFNGATKLYVWRAETSATYLKTLTINRPASVTITDLSAIDGSTYTGKNYATLFYSDVALAIPSGVKAYTYKMDGEALVVSRTYENGGTYPVIPAGEAVVVESDAGASYNFNVSTTETTVDTNSLLEGTDASTTIDESGYKYYKLAMNDALTSVGFYFAVDGGTSITNGAHKAYLRVSTTASKEYFVLGGEGVEEPQNETDGINAVDIAIANGATIYNLAGQKVGANYKGIVVINGKKVVRK